VGGRRLPDSAKSFYEKLRIPKLRDAELCRYIGHYAELSSGLWLDAVLIPLKKAYEI
jgi:hypothetical protein